MERLLGIVHNLDLLKALTRSTFEGNLYQGEHLYVHIKNGFLYIYIDSSLFCIFDKSGSITYSIISDDSGIFNMSKYFVYDDTYNAISSLNIKILSIRTSQLSFIQRLASRHRPLKGKRLNINVDSPCSMININSLEFPIVQINGKVSKIISNHTVSLLTMDVNAEIDVSEMPKLLFVSFNNPNILISYKDEKYSVNENHPRFSELNITKTNINILPFGSLAGVLTTYIK